jgi:branched-chain amino acid aminotransferase
MFKKNSGPQKSLFSEKTFFASQPILNAFETFRLWNGQFLHLDFHWQRLQQSCATLGFVCPKKTNFFMIANNLKTLYGNGYRFRINVDVQGEMTYIARAFESYVPAQKDKICLHTCFFERLHPTAKYDSPMYAYFQKNAAKNVWETLFVDTENRITEGSRTNIIFFKKNKLIVPNAGTHLEGTFLKSILAAWPHKITHRSIFLWDMNLFDGVVLCNSLHGIVPIDVIDDHVFTQSNQCKSAIEQYL